MLGDKPIGVGIPLADHKIKVGRFSEGDFVFLGVLRSNVAHAMKPTRIN
ncbi:hypothetical protein [Tabrizicola sp.]